MTVVRHDYWTCGPEPTSHNYWSLHALESMLHNLRRHHRGKPTQLEWPPLTATREPSHSATKTQHSQMIKYILQKRVSGRKLNKKGRASSIWITPSKELLEISLCALLWLRVEVGSVPGPQLVLVVCLQRQTQHAWNSNRHESSQLNAVVDDRDCEELKVFIGLGFLEGGKGQGRFTEDEGLEMVLKKKDLECVRVCACMCTCVWEEGSKKMKSNIWVSALPWPLV